jgi:crotonobetainyl-CoA:carnitine CoA-transferase CaiB-like acyl-CoA transferase
VGLIPDRAALGSGRQRFFGYRVDVTQSNSSLPLARLRVLDLTTGVSGGYASKLLADAGADVLKVELPGGDSLRSRGRVGDSFDASGDGLLFRYLHTSKRSCVLDLDHEPGKQRLLGLYAECDLVLDSTDEGWLEVRALGEAALAGVNPAASFLSITAFGRGGAWSTRPANDFTLQAWCGSTSARGRAGLPPIHAGGEVGDWLSGTCLAVAALAAKRKADRDGVGERVDVSKLEAITPTLTNAGSVWGYFSDVWALPASEDVPSIEPTSDGWIGFCIFTSQQWQDFSVLIEEPELGLDPELNHMMTRVARSAELLPLVRNYTRRFTTAELLERAELLRVPAAPIGHGALLPEIDHLQERGVFVKNPRGGFKQPRIPYASSEWTRRAFDPAPTLVDAERAGENPALGWLDEERSDAVITTGCSGEDAHRGDRPLAGLRVLDLTAFWAGPYGSYMLSGLGADVIHVESIQRPDGMRFGTMVSPDSEQWWEHGPTFHSANAGKRSLTLDLMSEEGVDLLLKLVAKSDVVIENFSPRVMHNFGLDEKRLSEANPRVIFVRMPAFGLDGPWRERVGFAQTMEQVSGLAWMTSYGPSCGDQAGPLTPRACADPLAGLHAAFATLVALAHRDRTGRGCAIESVMVETVLGVTAEGVLEYDATGQLMQGDGNRSTHLVPQGLYDCQGVDSLGAPNRMALSVETDEQWQALAREIGNVEWAEATRFSSALARQEAHDEIDDAIARWSRERSVEAAVEGLLSLGIPAAVVMPTRLGTTLPPIRESDFVQTVEHALAGQVPTPTHPFRFASPADRSLVRPAPQLGEHNYEILKGILGLSEGAMEELEEKEVLGRRPLGL